MFPLQDYQKTEQFQRVKALISEVLSDGGKGEAVAWRIFDGEGNYDYVEDEPSECNVNYAARYGRKYEPLFTAPQAECEAPYSAPFTTDVVQCCGEPSTCNDPCEPPSAQAECAPREAQPDTTGARIERLRKGLFEARDAMRVMSNWSKKSDPAGYGWAVRMVDRANGVLNHEPEVAAPTPERADAEKDAALTDDRIEEIWKSVEWRDLNHLDARIDIALRNRFARAILAANTEKK
jgi:hypothetical protein